LPAEQKPPSKKKGKKKEKARPFVSKPYLITTFGPACQKNGLRALHAPGSAPYCPARVTGRATRERKRNEKRKEKKKVEKENLTISTMPAMI